MIELERKFNVSDDVLKAIKGMGAVKSKKIKTFTDVYYDTSENRLTENNFWLRQRDEKWELKSPVDQRSADEKLLNSSYKETENQSDIIQLILPILQGNISSSVVESFNSLHSCLEHYKVTPFSSITTHRMSFSLEDFMIDIDTTDTGFHVGEVELLLNTHDQISNASQRIDALVTKLGLPLEEKVSGKMGFYLKNNRPDHYRRLCELKILV